MYLHFSVLTCAAIGIAAGFHYRASAALFFAGFTYIELLDKATYLNHYYLVSLLSALLLVLPAHRAWSLDVRRRPQLATRTIPAWTVNLLRFQIAVVYVFAGLAKLDEDWLLHAQPLRIWLAARSDLPILGPWLAETWVAYAFSWLGASYDLTIVWALLWTRTRAAAFVSVVVFHVMTWVLFPIGIFPWVMVVCSLLFFPADWPRRWMLRRFGRQEPVPPTASYPVSNRLVAVLAVYAAIQIAVPLASFWPGVDPNWTGRGFNFAWRVMLVEKAGHAEFMALDPSTGVRWPLHARNYITERQERMMVQDPFMIRALARRMAADLCDGGAGLEVRVDAFVSLNGRPAARLIDPHANLAGELSPTWILPAHSNDPIPSPLTNRVYVFESTPSPLRHRSVTTGR